MSTKIKNSVPAVRKNNQLQFNQLEMDRCQSITKLFNEFKEISCKYVKISLKKICAIGELLIEQKEELKHGEFGPWVDKNLPFTHRTANRYMEIYKNWGEANLENVDTMGEALRYIRQITSNDTPSPKNDEGEKTKIIITPSPEERDAIMDALSRVMALLDTISMTRAIYTIAADWLESKDDKTVLPPLEEKIHLLEKIYDVKLVVQSNA